jgi:two-component system sensor histidine kinase PilS (NtrC family)
VTGDRSASGLAFSRRDLLKWLYLGRVMLASGVLVGSLLAWFRGAGDTQTVIATAAFILALTASATAYVYTHVLDREPGENFLYTHVLLDVVLATVIVHLTGGGESTLTPLYILVIAEGALLLPLPGGVLIGGLASSLYFADIIFFGGDTLRVNSLVFQIVLFTLVALATGYLGDRLRRAGIALGEVQSELEQLQTDTGEILDSVTSGVLTVDGTGRLVYVNPAAEGLLGIDGSRWIGSPVVSVLDDIAPGMGTLLKRSIEDGRPISRSKTRARVDGRVATIGVSTTVLERDERSSQVTALFQDITESERMEALNRRTERLEAVAELSASLAHEIKNPLASIRSAVEQMASPELDAEDRETLTRLVLTQSDRLSRLLSEFLEFSGLRMGAAESVDLAEIVRDGVALASQHPERADEVEVRLEGADSSIRLPGDADLLHRATFNLVLNAFQFAGPDGCVTIRLEARPGDLPGEARGVKNPVRLTVSDTGPGVSPEAVPRIFDPFFTTREGGSGLGLSVVHRAVRAHEGAVLVGNAPDGGAEFTIYLPGPAPSTST